LKFEIGWIVEDSHIRQRYWIFKSFVEDIVEENGNKVVAQFILSPKDKETNKSGQPKSWKFCGMFGWRQAKTMGSSLLS
jgi:hypothetical protein